MALPLKYILFIIAYLATAKVGLAFGTVNGSATIFWPPGGIALAVVLIGGIRYLPAVFIAAYLASVIVDSPLLFGLGSAIGNTLETFLGFILLTRYCKFDLRLNNIDDLLCLVAFGGLVPAIASAIFGPVTLAASGLISMDLLPDIVWRWWRADVLGITFFTPLILIFSHMRSFYFGTSRTFEIAALILISIVLGQIVFLGWMPEKISDQPLSVAWLFPVLAWAGFRTGRRITSVIQLMFLCQALASAYFEQGIFSDDFSRYGLSNFWIFSMLLATVGTGLAIIFTASRHATQKAELNAQVFDVSHDGVMIVDAQNNIVSINPAFTRITGYLSEEVIGKDPRILSSGRHDPDFHRGVWESLQKTGCWDGEVWNRHKNGSVYLEQLCIRTVTDSNNRVINRVGIFSDITQERAARESITHQAHHDFLTNLPNRLLFCDRFNQQLAIANRHKTKFAMICLDLDSFKPINDTLGHHIGDLLLVAVADRLTSLVREIDTVSRFGGDEFAILVSEVGSIEDVTTLAGKVLTSLNQPFLIGDHTINISGSLGVALYPDHGTDMQTLMHNADMAMYQAKRNGGNSYTVSS